MQDLAEKDVTVVQILNLQVLWGGYVPERRNRSYVLLPRCTALSKLPLSNSESKVRECSNGSPMPEQVDCREGKEIFSKQEGECVKDSKREGKRKEGKNDSKDKRRKGGS